MAFPSSSPSVVLSQSPLKTSSKMTIIEEIGGGGGGGDDDDNDEEGKEAGKDKVTDIVTDKVKGKDAERDEEMVKAEDTEKAKDKVIERGKDKDKDKEEEKQKQKEKVKGTDKEKEKEKDTERDKVKEKDTDTDTGKDADTDTDAGKDAEKDSDKEGSESSLSTSTSPSSLPDSAALEDSSLDTLEEQTALSQSVPEVRDVSLSRFSKRFRFSNRYMKLAKYESDNETYYPRDHVRDGQLWNARKRMMEGERQTLRSVSASFQSFLPFYENFTAYLKENPTNGIISEKQWDMLNSLKGTAQSHYRKGLTAKLNREMNRRAQVEKTRRSKLLRRLVRRSGPVCDACKVKTPYSLPLSGGGSAKRLILRKFVGNREEFTIYNSTFCRRERKRSEA